MNSVIEETFDNTPMKFTPDGWFNATIAAEKFGKLPNEWLRLPETKEYLIALESTYGKIPHVKTSRARSDRGGGTWLHPKLAVPFARWLDVRFAVWCDEQIDRLIRGDIDVRRARHQAASSYRLLSDVLKHTREQNGKATKRQHFINEARLVNWALTGRFGPIDRDGLSFAELDRLAELEVLNTRMIATGMPYEQRKAALPAAARHVWGVRHA